MTARLTFEQKRQSCQVRDCFGVVARNRGAEVAEEARESGARRRRRATIASGKQQQQNGGKLSHLRMFPRSFFSTSRQACAARYSTSCAHTAASPTSAPSSTPALCVRRAVENDERGNDLELFSSTRAAKRRSICAARRIPVIGSWLFNHAGDQVAVAPDLREFAMKVGKRSDHRRRQAGCRGKLAKKIQVQDAQHARHE